MYHTIVEITSGDDSDIFFINIILIKQDKHRHHANRIFSTQKSRDITSLGKHVGNRQPAQ